MKTTWIGTVAFVMLTTATQSQVGTQADKLTVVSIEVRGAGIDAVTAGNMVRLEIEKLKAFQVADKHDVLQYFEERKANAEGCYGKSCVLEVARGLNSSKAVCGSVEHLGKFLVVSLKLVDVATGTNEIVYVHEFLNLPDELQNMIKLSVAEMFRKPFDDNLMRKLSKPNDFDNVNNNPTIVRLRLDGPRMGFVTFTGDLRGRITAPKSQGGLDCYPYMFQFGYQFEKQYLNEGKVQALVEFIPMVSGLDQAQFLPSFTLLHGVRSNVNGWELAFGPSIYILTVSKGYYDAYGNWVRQVDAKLGADEPEPEYIERLDRRGFAVIRSAFVIAAGRTFKSGRLNIPVNVFVVPGRYGWRAGFSFGFNAKSN